MAGIKCKKIRIAVNCLLCLLLLFAVSCDNGEHVHSYDSITQQCSCGDINSNVVAYIGSDFSHASARFLSLQDAVDYLNNHANTRGLEEIRAFDVNNTIHGYGESINCAGLTIGNIEVKFDFANTVVNFTGTAGITVNGGNVDFSGKKIVGNDLITSLITVTGGVLKTAVDFEGAICVDAQAQIVIESGKVVIEKVEVTGTGSSEAKNITLLSAEIELKNVEVVSQIQIHVSSESTVIPAIPDHSHSFVLQIATDDFLKTGATCTTKPVYYKSCSCGLKGTETFEEGSALGHSFSDAQYVWSEDYVCTATRVCERTGCSYEESEVAPGEYNVVNSATEQVAGLGRYTASFKNNEFSTQTKDVEIPKLDHVHNYVLQIATDDYLKTGATCTTKPVYYKSCSCGLKGTETFEEGSALGHDLQSHSAKAATCSEVGWKDYQTCSRCDYTTYEEIPVNSNNHLWDVFKVSESGDVTTYKCKYCGETKDVNNSMGLEYRLISETDSYTVVGIGDCEDVNIIIPSRYNGKSVTSIGSSAFYGCTGLTSITIPSSVISIGYDAFYDCTGLTSIIIPDSVINIYDLAFSGCTGLTSITVDKNNPEYYSEGNCVIAKGTQTLVFGCKTSVIPKDVTSIGEQAFRRCTGLTSITIPDSVTSIGGDAFYDCEGLTSVTISEGVTSIDNYAFSGCSGLTSITIPSSVTSIGSSAFRDCRGLTSVTISEGVTSIGSSAFVYCRGLTSITIPDSVTSIGAYAFSGCEGLTSITIPDSVTSIGEVAFGSCRGLTSITVDKNNPKYYSEGNCVIEKVIKTLVLGCKTSVIPNDVTSIGEGAFEDCSGLTSITIPDSVTSIGAYAFAYCTGLTSITIPSRVTSIGNGAFEYCSGLTSITIPSRVTSIGSSAFYGCSGLTSITIPSSVTSIGSSAFYGCSGLTSVTISEGVKNIGRSAFYGCSGLTSITLPFVGGSQNSNTYFGYIFGASSYNNNSNYVPSSLKNVEITSATSIGEYAFYGCSGLTSITINKPKDSISGSPWGAPSSTQIIWQEK